MLDLNNSSEEKTTYTLAEYFSYYKSLTPKGKQTFLSGRSKGITLIQLYISLDPPQHY